MNEQKLILELNDLLILNYKTEEQQERIQEIEEELSELQDLTYEFLTEE